MKQAFTFIFLVLGFGLFAQTVADFENYTLQPESYINDSGSENGFTSGNVFLPNFAGVSYGYEYWNGWAISNSTDTQTSGYTNDYSAITGGGYNSDNYAVFYNGEVILEGDAAGGVVEGFYITNSTYAALSMQDGDSFAKKFGGESGDDPDFFLLTIKRYYNGALDNSRSVEFYLADYRFADNSQDYIVNTWEWVNLNSLGNVDSLYFELSSSDVGQFGMNTPSYFCADDITTSDQILLDAKDQNEALAFNIFPNPTQDQLMLDWPSQQNGTATVFDLQGKMVEKFQAKSGMNQFNVANLPAGVYVVQVAAEEGFYARRFVKE